MKLIIDQSACGSLYSDSDKQNEDLKVVDVIWLLYLKYQCLHIIESPEVSKQLDAPIGGISNIDIYCSSCKSESQFTNNMEYLEYYFKDYFEDNFRARHLRKIIRENYSQTPIINISISTNHIPADNINNILLKIYCIIDGKIETHTYFRLIYLDDSGKYSSDRDNIFYQPLPYARDPNVWFT